MGSINNVVRFNDAQFCDGSTALMQKYIELYLWTAARSYVLIVL